MQAAQPQPGELIGRASPASSAGDLIPERPSRSPGDLIPKQPSRSPGELIPKRLSRSRVS